MSGWIGVDLDGTLAKYDQWVGPGIIGEPIPKMVQRVKDLLARGKTVKIFTARVAHDPKGLEQSAIQAWCHRNIGQILPVTATKDHNLIYFYDDRAIQVEQNTGRIIGDGGSA